MNAAMLRLSLCSTALAFALIAPAFAQSPSAVPEANKVQEAAAAEDSIDTLRARLAGAERDSGPTSRQTLDALNALIDVYSDQALVTDATDLAERAVVLSERLNGTESREFSDSLLRAAIASASAGKYLRAIELLERNAEITERTLGSKHPSTAIALTVLAMAFQADSQWQRARSTYERSIAISENIPNADRSAMAESLRGLTEVYGRLGQYEQALAMYQRRLSSEEDALTSEHTNVAENLRDKAAIYQNAGKYTEALSFYLRSLSLIERTGRSDQPDVTTTLENLASLYANLEQYPLAIRMAERSLSITEKYFGAVHLNTATSLNNLGMLHTQLTHYDKALPLLERSLMIVENIRGHDHPDVAPILNNIALLFLNLGEYGKASKMLERSVAITEKALGNEHPEVATALHNLAWTYRGLSRGTDALLLCQRALEIDERSLGHSHPALATILNTLGILYQDIGQHAKALPLIRRSLSITEATLGSDHLSAAFSLYNLAASHIELNQAGLAQEELERVITTASLSPAGRVLLAAALGAVAELHANAGHPDLAILYGKQAVNTLQSLRAETMTLPRELQTSFLADKRDVYEYLAERLIEQGRIDEAQQVLQMLKEQELYESVQRGTGQDPRTTTMALSGLERAQFEQFYVLRDQQIQLVNERQQLDAKRKAGTLNPTETKRLEQLSTELIPTLTAGMRRFLAQVQEQMQAARHAGESVVDVKMTQTHLQKAVEDLARLEPQAHAVALQYLVGERQLSIVLSAPGAPAKAWQYPIGRASLNKQIVQLRELLRTGKSDLNTLQAAAKALYAQLLPAPVMADLKQLEAKTLMLSLTDTLRYVPFGALYDGRHWLVQDYALAVFNEAGATSMSQAPGASWRIAGLGLSERVDNLEALAAVPDELKAVVGAASGDVALNNKFGRQRLLDALDTDYNVLHVASHFVFTSGRTDASWLYLGDKTRLSLGDIVGQQMRFDRMELVTLSACETAQGGGKDAYGQEMEGLGATAQNQGAQAVMATLWKVNDWSTAALMERFYRGRSKDKLNKAQALRAAQMALIEQKAGKQQGWNHPYFWAPFILMGNWR